MTIDLFAADAIAARIDTQREATRKARRKLCADPYIFSPILSGDRPPGPNSVTALWSTWRRRLAPDGSLRHVRLGDLRHLAVTQLLHAGIPVPVVAEPTGHHPVTMLRAYAHALPRNDKGAADVMAKLLGR